jgi:hypothetical protein
MALHDNDAITAFIRAKGVTRCPTACAAPTQAVVAATDRLMLRQRAERREAARETIREARARRRPDEPSLGWKIRGKEFYEASLPGRCPPVREVDKRLTGFGT